MHAGTSVQLAIIDLSKQITSVRRKMATLCDYYIHPDPIPSEIAAYDPRLSVLQTRLATLDKLDYAKLTYLFDDSDALAANYLLQITDHFSMLSMEYTRYLKITTTSH